MLIKKIKLENIRSYLAEEINFPDGSVLLSGDIGAGKSSILLAIDFVLFGLSPGRGSALLRNGEDKGSVELYFNIDDKDVVVKRTLKRRKNSVTQDYGYLLINNEKIEGTAMELRARILDLLSYPKELLTKSKDLIYRYTVYTPQEEMRAILIGDKDSRLETLRKVFGIDKYKRVVENSNVFLKSLKNKINEFNIRIENLDKKVNEKKEIEERLKKIKEEIVKVLTEFYEIEIKLKKKREEIKTVEERIKEKNEFKNKLNIEENNLRNYKERSIEGEREISNLKNEIKVIERELRNKREENIEELIKKKREFSEKIILKENEIRELRDKVVRLNSKKEESESLKEKISKLNNCPTCLQQVRDEHKSKIIKKAEKNIKVLISEVSKIDVGKEEENLKLIKDELENLKEKISEVNILKLKFRNLDESKNKLKILEKNNLELNNKINESSKKISEINEKIKDFEDLDGKYNLLRKEFDELIEEDKKIGIRKAGLEENQRNILENIENLKREILIMEKIKDNLMHFEQLDKWLNDVFINMMGIMEKKIMLRAYSDFNNLFQKWFDILVSNELLNVKLDEEFTPIIILNGYETDYAHLSGGERTAAALAYRLALNQVINNLMSDIKTRDLIILDEPTDGFSSEQLDRVKLVLQELNLRQVIIVSHEAKVESFVDNVLRFEKKEHVSKLV